MSIETNFRLFNGTKFQLGLFKYKKLGRTPHAKRHLLISLGRIGTLLSKIWLCFHNWISLKEICWFELKTARYSRHNGEVFLAWNMMETQCIPKDNVSVLYSSVPAMPTIIFLQNTKQSPPLKLYC
jgi:hypothetical protein